MSDYFDPRHYDLPDEEKCSDLAKAATAIVLLLSLIKAVFHKNDDTDGRE